MDQRKFGPSGVCTHDLRIRSTGALPTELRGKHGTRSFLVEVHRKLSKRQLSLNGDRHDPREMILSSK